MASKAVICAVLSVLVLLVESGSVTVSVSDSNSRHVYQTSFSITVTVSACTGTCGTLQAQWRTEKDVLIGSTITLTYSGSRVLTSPSTAVGFYDFVVYSSSASDSVNGLTAGQPKRFGFAILPSQPAVDGRTWNPSVQFGMVMADLDDPYLPNCWVKTLTWDTTSSDWWLYETNRRRSKGRAEVPLITGTPWTADDVTATKTKIKPYLAADTSTIYWELGLEENLGSGYGTTSYFQTLANKAQACRDAANEVSNPAKFIYQIVGTSYDSSFQSFLASPAAAKFQILSIHPYRWNAFESPESWLESFLVALRSGMDASGNSAMKIWITEVGAPINTNPTGHYGYPGVEVTGITRARQADYSTKLNVIALHNKVEKIFWYNYKDAGTDFTYAEDNFGMVDYWGYPKPTYPAQFTTITKLSGRTPGSFKKNAGTGSNVWSYSFVGSSDMVIVAWLNPDATASVPLSTIYTGLTAARVLSITSNVGAPLSLSGSNVALSSSPVFITVSTTACDSVTCYNGGTCSSGVCSCPFPYSGTDCSGCSCVHGTCSTGACVCSAGYTGTLCDTTAGGASPSTIYEDSVGANWVGANARSVISYTATGAWAGSYCVSMKNTGGWGNLEFDYSSTFSTSSYTHLHFAVKSSVAATLSVAAYQTWTSTLVYKDISTTTAWQEIFIPLANINAADSLIATVFFIENLAASNTIFYLDKIEFVNIPTKTIYTDALVSGWTVSNARSVVNYAVTPAWSGTYALSVQNTGGWGNLPFDSSASINTRPYTHIHFAVKSNVASATLSVAAYQTWSSSLVYKDISTTTSWKDVYVPLSQVNAANTQILTVFFIENLATTNNIFYLDSVEIVSVLPKGIYSDSLAPNWSVSNARSVINYAVGSAWNGNYCLSLQNTGGWGNLPFDYSTNIYTGPYTHLHFAVKSNVAATLSLAAYQTWSSSLVYKDISTTTSWQDIYVPLSQINAANTQIRTVFFIENLAATNNIFYLDKIEFVRVD